MSKSNCNVVSEKNHRGLFAFILAAMISTSGYNTQAAVFMWNNTGTQWTSGTSWVGGTPPASNSSSTTTDEVQFGNVGANFNAVDMTSSRAVQNLTFFANANAYTFGTTSAKILASRLGITNNSTATQTFNVAVENANADNTWTQVTGGSLVFNNSVGLTTAASATSRTLTLAGGGTFTFNGSLTQGQSAGSKLTVNNSGGVVNLNGANTLGGGVTLTAGTLNINNNNALGGGALSLAGTGATINNTSGAAVVNAGNQAWTWSDGLAFGSSTNTAANNLNLGTGVVTASSTRTIALAGTGTKLTIGAVNITSISSGRTITANGAGNTLEMGGLTLSASATPVTVTLAGTANLGVTGAIVNGTTPGNGLTVTATGTTTFSGNNTYSGLTTMNAAGGTLTLSGDNSAASGGVTLTAGTLNINNNNALGGGALSLAGTGATINNTSGAAVVNAGNQAWALADGLAFGSATNTAANNLNLGTGVVTVAGNRTIALAGTGTKLTIGAVNITSTSSGRTITANGAGNILEMGGLTLSASATPVTVTLAGTANLGVTGAIVNGTTPGNGLTVTATGTTTFSGNNTYTGVTTISAGTTILSGNNSSATGGLVVAGASATTDKPVLRLNSVNAISSGSTISGASSSDRVGTLDFNAGTAYTLNSYSGGTMNFVNSFGQDSVVTFTSAANILTSSAGSTGGRSLQNNSANLDIVFNGSLDIGSSVTDTVNTIGGAGDFVVKGNIFSTTVGSVRGLNKTGAGLLEMRGDNNSYNGSTSIFNGTISVTNGAVLTGTTVRVAPSIGNSGTLLVNGTAGAVVVSARGILAGGGTVGDVKLENGSFLKPGNSPGLLTAASSTWAAGSTYNWEIDNATGTAGTNWDVFSVTGALDLSALSSNAKMNLVLESLSIANFSTSTAYDNWVIAQAGSFIGTGLADGTDVTSLFNINTAAFNGGAASNLPNGGFQVLTGTEGSLRTLTLMAVPEPSTGSMFGLGLAGLVATRLLRRKTS
jgi:autotransporter-associated beta strand protein